MRCEACRWRFMSGEDPGQFLTDGLIHCSADCQELTRIRDGAMRPPMRHETWMRALPAVLWQRWRSKTQAELPVSVPQRQRLLRHLRGQVPPRPIFVAT